MAVTNLSISDTYDALLSTTLRYYAPTLQDNIFQALPLLYWLNEKGRKRTQDGGYEIMVPLLYGENTTVGVYQKYDVLNVTPQEGITHARFQWKNMSVSISISREEERKNSGPHKMIDLLKAKTMQAEKSAEWYLNDLLHGIYGSREMTFVGGDTGNAKDSVGGTSVDITGDDAGKSFNSLDHIIRSGWGMVVPNTTAATTQSHIVGGITCTLTMSTASDAYIDWAGTAAVNQTATTNPWWLNYCNPGFLRLSRGMEGGKLGAILDDTELDYSGGCEGTSYQNTIAAMRSMYNRIADGADHTDLILSGQAMYDTYEACLMPLERFTDTKLGDAGFQNLKFKGATMMLDHGIITPLAAGAASAADQNSPMYFIDSDYVEWVVDKESDFEPTPFVRPENQAARTAQILLMAQLCCNNRSKQGIINFATGSNYTP